jgi:ATP-dependent DNA helicase PIF1
MLEAIDWSVACTAATGVAAVNLSGGEVRTSTLHSWGLGSKGEMPLDQLIKNIRTNPKLVRRWTGTRVLIIDEISMISADLFYKMSKIGSFFRKNDQPFGGIIIVASGDFLQLPPVNGEWVFSSPEFERCAFEKISFLTPWRYLSRDGVEEDVEGMRWYKLLSNIREGRPSEQDILLLESRKEAYNDLLRGRLNTSVITNGSASIPTREEYVILPTNLYSKRADADRVNAIELKKLNTQEYTFTAYDEFSWFDSYTTLPEWKKIKTKENYISSLEDAIPKKITLKQGAQVMLKWNVDVEMGLANGTVGVITAINAQSIKVKWENSLETFVEVVTWVKEDEDAYASRTQFPLVLSWAMTIHKSQGCTLKRAVCDIGSDIFSPAQAYVAISRVERASGLFLRSFIPSVLYASDEALKFLGISKPFENK